MPQYKYENRDQLSFSSNGILQIQKLPKKAKHLCALNTNFVRRLPILQSLT